MFTSNLSLISSFAKSRCGTYCLACVAALVYCFLSWSEEGALLEAGCVGVVLILCVGIRSKNVPVKKKLKEIEVPDVVKAVPCKRDSRSSWADASADTRPVRQTVPQALVQKESKQAYRSSSRDTWEVGSGLEPHILITAVRKARFWELPKLFDSRYARQQAIAENLEQLEKMVLADVLAVLRTCSVVNHHKAGLDAYDHCAERLGSTSSGDLWSLLLYSSVECVCFDRCEKTYASLQKMITPSKHDFVNIVRAFAHYKNIAGFEQLLVDIERRGIKFCTVTRSRALHSCSSENCRELVHRLLKIGEDSIFDEVVNTMNFDHALKGFARRGALKHCMELRDMMLAEKLKPTQMTFGILLDACVRAADFTRAKCIFAEFKATGLEPNAVHYTTVIKALVHAGRMSEVSGLIEEMEASANAKPDIITYQQLVNAYVEHQDIGAALRLINVVIEHGLKPDRIMYESILHGLCMRPMSSSEILSIFDSFVSKGLEPSIQTVSVVVKALSVSKKWAAALKFLSSVQTRFGIRLEARLYAQLGLWSLKAGDIKVAADIYEEMLKVMGAWSVSSGAMSRLLRDCIQLDISEATVVAFGDNCEAVRSAAIVPSAPAAANNKSIPDHMSARFAQFVEINGLDARCTRLLTSIETAKVEWVMDQEFILKIDTAKGTASAKVVGTVQRAHNCNQAHEMNDWRSYPTPRDLKRRLEVFVQLNSLSCECVEALKALPEEHIKWVMDVDFVIEGTSQEKAGKVNSTIELAHKLPVGGSAIAMLLEEFISVNQLDERCANSLRKRPRADAAWVMDQEWHIVVDQSRGTAAAKVVGLLNKLKAEQRENEERSMM